MQKELEIIEATKDKRSVVDLKIDDKPVGRLVVNRNQQYDFNLQTEIDKKKKPDGELLVDLKIDGAKGPVPKIVNVRKPKGRTFIDTDQGIKQIQSSFTADHNLAAQIGADPSSESASLKESGCSSAGSNQSKNRIAQAAAKARRSV